MNRDLLEGKKIDCDSAINVLTQFATKEDCKDVSRQELMGAVLFDVAYSFTEKSDLDNVLKRLQSHPDFLAVKQKMFWDTKLTKEGIKKMESVARKHFEEFPSPNSTEHIEKAAKNATALMNKIVYS